MGAEQALKIILRIKFPQRHSKPPASAENQATNKHAEIVNGLIARSSSDVPAPPINTAVGEKASLLPKRTPASEREFEAILTQDQNPSTSNPTVAQQNTRDQQATGGSPRPETRIRWRPNTNQLGFLKP
ncbi:uncharacterized protein LOC120172144 [Hibiscus syriacus]|uniref:uncharacterized protein LOC120172144 n=1 Tax=Hibiscus syriacus TaxID=106335 RepID=UPI0019206C36|nr:uncharacterized protein LOC120172144 [Hibiscus syriacus]